MWWYNGTVESDTNAKNIARNERRSDMFSYSKTQQAREDNVRRDKNQSEIVGRIFENNSGWIKVKDHRNRKFWKREKNDENQLNGLKHQDDDKKSYRSFERRDTPHKVKYEDSQNRYSSLLSDDEDDEDDDAQYVAGAYESCKGRRGVQEGSRVVFGEAFKA